MKKILSLFLYFTVFLFFNVHAQQDFYWIGGDGAWNDTTQWSSTSGGAADKISLPTKADNVFFDVNSFDSLGQEGGVAFNTNATGPVCNEMIWSGVQYNPAFSYDSLYVHGSLTFDTAMSLNLPWWEAGEIFFRSRVLSSIN